MRPETGVTTDGLILRLNLTCFSDFPEYTNPVSSTTEKLNLTVLEEIRLEHEERVASGILEGCNETLELNITMRNLRIAPRERISREHLKNCTMVV